jgi:hypothetical protein
VADVVLVYSDTEAEGYRATDSINGANPLDLQTPFLHKHVDGTVTEVVTAVLGWPAPVASPSYFSSSSAPRRTSNPGAGAFPASD